MTIPLTLPSVKHRDPIYALLKADEEDASPALRLTSQPNTSVVKDLLSSLAGRKPTLLSTSSLQGRLSIPSRPTSAVQEALRKVTWTPPILPGSNVSTSDPIAEYWPIANGGEGGTYEGAKAFAAGGRLAAKPIKAVVNFVGETGRQMQFGVVSDDFYAPPAPKARSPQQASDGFFTATAKSAVQTAKNCFISTVYDAQKKMVNENCQEAH